MQENRFKLMGLEEFQEKKLLICKTPKIKTFYEAVCFQKKWDLNKRPESYRFYEGFDSWVLECDSKTIYKFPKNEAALYHLYKEYCILKDLPPFEGLALPKMSFYHQYFYFSEHAKIPGNPLTREQVEALKDDERIELAQKLAKVLAHIHRTPKELVKQFPVENYSLFGDLKECSQFVEKSPLFPKESKSDVQLAIEVCRNEKDRDRVFGHFDIHGGNVGYEADQKQLRGVFDFADCALMNFNAEFMCPAGLGPELLNDLMIFYEANTHRVVNREIVSAFRILMLASLIKIHAQLKKNECVERFREALDRWIHQDSKKLR